MIQNNQCSFTQNSNSDSAVGRYEKQTVSRESIFISFNLKTLIHQPNKEIKKLKSLWTDACFRLKEIKMWLLRKKTIFSSTCKQVLFTIIDTFSTKSGFFFLMFPIIEFGAKRQSLLQMQVGLFLILERGSGSNICSKK